MSFWIGAFVLQFLVVTLFYVSAWSKAPARRRPAVFFMSLYFATQGLPTLLCHAGFLSRTTAVMVAVASFAAFTGGFLWWMILDSKHSETIKESREHHEKTVARLREMIEANQQRRDARKPK